MEKFNLKIHPLFFLLGIYYAITGRILIFVIYTVCAVMHEMGHSIVAEANGYKLKKLTLMPFGAVVGLGGGDISVKDQLKIALAGPMLNLAVGILFVAVWWIYPQTYAFTDIAAEANFSLALINLLPAYPLDGGRVLFSLIAVKRDRKKAVKICRLTGFVLAGILFALFIATLFFVVNATLLLFALFIFFGTIKDNDGGYVKMVTVFSPESLKKGVPFKKFAVDKSVTLKKVMQIVDKDAINEIVVIDNGEVIRTIGQKKLNELIERQDIYQPISEFITKT